MEDITHFLDPLPHLWKLQEGDWRENNLEKQILILLLNLVLGSSSMEIPSSPQPFQIPRVLSEHQLP